MDLIDWSSGGLMTTQIDFPYNEGWNSLYSDKIKKSGDILTGAVGGIVNPVKAEEFLKQKKADLIFVGREFLRNPLWVQDSAKAFDLNVEFPVQYQRSKR